MPDTRTGAEEIRWDLSELFSGIDDPQIDIVLEEAQNKVTVFMERYRGKLATLSAEKLAAAYAEREVINGPVYRLNQYAHLLFSVDTSDDDVKALVARVDEASSLLHNQMLFFNLELGALTEEDFSRFENQPILTDYAYKLDKIRRNARYNLTEKEEQVINLKDLNGVTAHQKLYNELTASFQFDFELDGEIQKLNGDQLRALRQHPDPDVRSRAMEMFFGRYAENKLIFTHLYNSIVKDYGIEVGVRGYRAPISAMNSHNDLADDAVQALNDVTTESYPLVQRYYEIKKKLLDLPEMTLADIYAPLPEASRAYNFDDARELVLSAFGGFDGEFRDLAFQMFEENRIDAPVLPGKRGGAFCASSTPGLKPYVFLNYTGKIRDVATLAHELGHAIHAMYSSEQKLINYHSILPLAETASIFSEMLLTDHFLKQESDKAVKISLLTNKLEDIFASSHRQNMFSRFELGSHERIGEHLQSSDDLCELYTGELEQMFGDSVKITPEFRWEWSSIPHIYSVPFYVYAYNFGNLLVLGLYQKYLEDGSGFNPGYKKFLSMGSSASPQFLTSLVGADISQVDFWRKSFAYIEGLIDSLEKLL